MGMQKIAKFWSEMLRENGAPSSTRVLMMLMMAFSCGVIGSMVYHMIRITDVGQLGIWLSNLPLVITALIGLITVPYGVNRGASMVSDMAKSYAQVNTARAENPVPVVVAAPVTPAAL